MRTLILYLILISLTPICGFAGAEAYSENFDQMAIPFNQIDSERQIISFSSHNQCSITPTLIIPESDRKKQASLFSLAMHSDWVVVMNEKGWQPYTGEIDLFDTIQLNDTIQPFQLDCTPFSGNSSDRIDFYYGYAVLLPFYFGNAVRLRLIESESFTDVALTISKPALSLETITVSSLPITTLPKNTEKISPSLAVPAKAIGTEADLYAAALIGRQILIKTVQGWRVLEEDEPGLTPFDTVILSSEQSGFDLETESLNNLLPNAWAYSDETLNSIFFYYAYISKTDTRFMGNIIRLQPTGSDCQTNESVSWEQQALPIENLQFNGFSDMMISDLCRALSPSLVIDHTHVGKDAGLFALIVSEDGILVKTSSGWEHYKNDALHPFLTITLQSEISNFEIPGLWQDITQDDSENPASPPSFNWYGNLIFYYAYAIEQETLKGNGFSLHPLLP